MRFKMGDKFFKRIIALILVAGISSNFFTVTAKAQDVSTTDVSISDISGTSISTEEIEGTGCSAAGTSNTGSSSAEGTSNIGSSSDSGIISSNESYVIADTTETIETSNDASIEESSKSCEDTQNDGTASDNESTDTVYYKVTLDACGGYVSTGTIEVQKGSIYKDLPTPMRDYYEFLGWSLIKTDDSSKAEYVTKETSVAVNEDHTLYAIWEPEEYKVSLNAGDGVIEDNNKELVIYVNYEKPYSTYHRYFIIEKAEDVQSDEAGTSSSIDEDGTEVIIKEGTPLEYTDIKEYEELPTPTLEGYEFLGWSTKESLSTDEEDILLTSDDKVLITKDHTLYARWSKPESSVEPTEDTKSSGNNAVNNDATSSKSTESTSADASLDTIAANASTAVTSTADDTDNIEDKDVTEDTSDGTTTEYTFTQDELTYLDEDSTSSLLTTSLLSVSSYSVTYRLQGGNFTDTDSVVFTVDAGDTLTKPEDPTRIKYDFKGWYTSADGDEEFDFSTPISADTYIYAQWEAKYKAKAPTVDIFRSRTDDLSGSDIAEDTRIQLSSSSYDVKIYYILNPTSIDQVPTDSDTLYTDALIAKKLVEDDGTITIRAIAKKAGYEDSEVSTFVFNVIPESDIWGELTDEDKALYEDPTGIPSGMWIAGITDKTYIGSAITFSQDEIRVYDGKKRLTYNTDYSISYRNNTNAGTATVIVTGKNNYSGVIQKTFIISPRDISEDSFSTSDIVLQYSGRIQKGTTSLVYNNGSKKITLRQNSDYTYTYPGTNTKSEDYNASSFVGSKDEDSQYLITITGKGNYTGTRTVTETIVSKSKVLMSNVSVSIPASQYTDKDENGYVCPTPILKYGGKTLTGYAADAFSSMSLEAQALADYTYYYTDNDHAGTGYIVFEGRNTYAGTRKASFSIKGVSIGSAKFTGFTDSFTYNGNEQKQESVVLTYNSVELIEGEDYSVTYSNSATNVGTITVTYTGLNGFTGSVKKSYKITAYNIANDAKSTDPKVSIQVLDEDGDNSFAYIKGGVTPLPVVTYDGTVLELNKDFTIRYSNNTSINASRVPTITVTGKGNFSGSISATFTIESQSISAEGIVVKANDKVYSNRKGNYTTSFVVADSNGKSLSAGTDYEKNIVYSYAENVTLYDGTVKSEGDIASSTDIVPAGTIMRITVTGKGYYSGTLSGTYRIVTGDVSKANVRVYTQYYTGDEVRPDKNQIEVKLSGIILSPEDYEITSYTNNINKGTGELTIKGVGDYGGSKTVNFAIAAKNMKYMVIFNGNGSTSGSISNQTIDAGKTVTLNTNHYARKNYVFTGWNTESDGSGISYANKQLITNDGSITGVNLVLFAQWEPENYKVIYHLNGGSNNAANTKLTYTAQDATFTIYAPEREDWETGYQFGGWYKDSAYKNRISEIRSGSSGDIHLYAKWIPYTYNVYFDGNGATSGNAIYETLSYGVSKALNTNEYAKKGSVFMGWALSLEDADDKIVTYTDKEIVVDLVSRRNNVDGQITLYAVWRDIFEIEYSLNGGTFESDDVPYEYTYGQGTKLLNPTREGYIFGGWYQDDAYKKRIYSVSDKMSGDYHLYAKWTPYAYTISFNGNGNNAGSVRVQKYTYGNAEALNANVYTKKGYIFTGWNTVKNPSSDNPGTSYSDMEVINILPSKNNATIILYAQWSETDYSVEYVLNGGSMPESTENYISEYEYNHKGGYKLPVPVKKGFTFSGWYKDESLKTKLGSIVQSSWGDITLYASWDMTYTVSFDPNSQDGDTLTGTMADQNIKYSSSKALRSNAYRSGNFIFMGWAVSSEDAANGIVTYKNDQKLQRPTEDILTYDVQTDTFKLRLYAVWKNVFRITYELNGGDFADTESLITEYTYSKTSTYSLINPSKDGYTFGGWYTDANFRSRISNIAKNSSGDKTLYAKWNNKNYKVNFIADPPEGKKASGRMGAQTLQYDKEKKLSKNAYKVSGYTFAGWSTKSLSERDENDQMISDTQLVDGIFDTYADVINLYAVWTKDTYSIIYNNVAGIDNSMNPDTYNVDDVITLEEPQSLGNTFLGWYSDSRFRNKVTTIKNGTTGNKVYYAKWATTQYTIRYDLNAGSDESAVLDTRNVGYLNSYSDKLESGYRLATASRQGYTFAGWYKEAACRNKVESIVSSPYIDMTLYAKWNPISYTVHFDKNDDNATGTMRDMTVKFCANTRLSSNSFKKKNNTFSGWNTESDGSGTSYTNGQVINSLTSEQGDTINLYAQWTPYSYKITYYLNKGTLSEDAPFGYSYGDEFELPTPTRKNYAFLGWYSDKNFTESKKVTAISAITAENITLYAKWKLDVIGDVVVPDEYISLSDFGAYPDDGESDSYALQTAIRRASSNASNGGVNTIYLPAGVYNITDIGNYDHGIELKSNINLVMDNEAVLKVSGMYYGDYEILSMRYLSNVTITGGKLVGERYSHSGYYGESGHGIAMHGSSDITISNMSISGNWGDGVYFGTQAIRQSDGSQKYFGNTDVVISNCEIFDNRRNSISLTDADRITIIDCNLYDSHGTAPQCCVYIEPNADSSDKVCEHILIKDTVMTAYKNKNDSEYMVFMTHYNPYNLSYVTASDVRFIGCELNGFFGNYSGLGVTFDDTSLNGTVVNLKKGQ